MKKSNVSLEQLKRWKNASKESTFEWLQSALELANAKKTIKKGKK